MNRSKNRRRLRLVLAFILALAGVSFLAYPTIDNWLYQNQVLQQKQDFTSRLYSDQADQQAISLLDDLFLYMQSENERLYEDGQATLVDAFSYERSGIDLESYGIADGCIGFVSIPLINIDLPVYLGANTSNLDKGAAHLTETSYPIGGTNTNSVIAAHRGETRNMFRHINKLGVGDEVIITNFHDQLVYRVVGFDIIHPNDVDLICIQEGRDMLTLISCHPPGTTTARYVVYCERYLP
ncbi:MAG: class C sortase [Coriobacteriia bacterium]|nr:class C sortase [Coriobacteriia bacterium]